MKLQIKIKYEQLTKISGLIKQSKLDCRRIYKLIDKYNLKNQDLNKQLNTLQQKNNKNKLNEQLGVQKMSQYNERIFGVQIWKFYEQLNNENIYIFSINCKYLIQLYINEQKDRLSVRNFLMWPIEERQLDQMMPKNPLFDPNLIIQLVMFQFKHIDKNLDSITQMINFLTFTTQNYEFLRRSIESIKRKKIVSNITLDNYKLRISVKLHCVIFKQIHYILDLKQKDLWYDNFNIEFEDDPKINDYINQIINDKLESLIRTIYNVQINDCGIWKLMKMIDNVEKISLLDVMMDKKQIVQL